MEYVIIRKMTTAKQLLISTDMPLTAVAEAVGYDNYSYFSKIFKKVTGYSPVRFRKKNEFDVNS